MATIKIPGSPEGQLGVGASVLIAAQSVDTTAVKPRLSKFDRAQRDFNDGHGKVKAAENRLGDAMVRLGELDVAQDAAVEALATALVVDGKPRANPFKELSALS